MAGLKGIRVDLETSESAWAASADALFLGVYGPGGGREFRLNSAIAIDEPDKAFSLVLGEPCCPTPADVPVQYSTAMGDNDPSLNPVDLAGIDRVYLRKETADSTVANDNVLALRRATVELCDEASGIRLWRREAPLNFSDESGLQHWLGEIDPPTCHVTVTLTRIRHHPTGAHAAGKTWYLWFGMGTANDFSWMLREHYYEAPTRDDWELAISGSRHITFVGCCGRPQTIYVGGFAYERDVSNADEGASTETIGVGCQKGSVTQSRTLDVTVDGILNHESRISYDYELTCSCID